MTASSRESIDSGPSPASPRKDATPPPLPSGKPPPVPPGSRSASAPISDVYASFGSRAVALIIDYFLVMIAAGVSLALIAPDAKEEKGSLVPFLFFIGIPWLYKAGLESSAAQATLGKRALGIKVTSMTGERLSFLHATGRFFAQLLNIFTLNIGYLVAAFTKRRQALHDLVASTLVTKKSRTPTEIASAPDSPRESSVWVVCAIVVVVIALIGILAAIALPAYQSYTIRAQVIEGVNLSGPYKEATAEALLSGRSAGFISSSNLVVRQVATGKYVEAIEVANAAIVITYGRQANTRLSGRHLVIYPVFAGSGDVVWVCGNHSLPFDSTIPDGLNAMISRTDIDSDMYLPANCRRGG